MLKSIKLDKDHSVEVNSSMGWLMIYRNQFGHDILPDLMPLIEGALGIAVNVAGKMDGNVFSINTLKKVKAEDLEDAFLTLSTLEATTFLNIFWALAKNADPDIDDPFDWINQFETMPLDIVGKELGKIIVTSLISKKKLRTVKSKLKTKNQSDSKHS